MNDKCMNCYEKCPQAERTKNAALGRMYATNEFISLQNKVDSGYLVEVVRCCDCEQWDKATVNRKGFLICPASGMEIMSDDYCSYGKRKEIV